MQVRTTKLFAVALATLTLILSAHAASADVWRLYRSGFLDPDMKIHMATFDTDEGGGVAGDYNGNLCRLTADFMRVCHSTDVSDCPGKPWFKTRYWCERG